MLQKLSQISSIICLLALIVLVISCAGGPLITVCISDPAKGGFDCYDEQTKINSFLAYADSDKFVAMSPTDAQTLANYCSQAPKVK